jgi:hypothetical protein
MFGHNDESQQDQNQNSAATAAPASMPGFTPPPSSPAPSVPGTDSSADAGMQLPGSDASSLPGNLTTPVPSEDASAAPAPATGVPVPTSSLTASPNDLLSIKQEALQNLSPLVDHLEQTPDEKFRTTMMMIQATDDSSKIKDAYEAAQQITDEKARAQALLDIVNEINYFTQQQKSEE